MKTDIMFQTSVETYRGKTNLNKQADKAEAAVNPLTSTLLVLIKTRCRENDCGEERNTSQTHMHACTHIHTHALPTEIRSSEDKPLMVMVDAGTCRDNNSE